MPQTAAVPEAAPFELSSALPDTPNYKTIFLPYTVILYPRNIVRVERRFFFALI